MAKPIAYSYLQECLQDSILAFLHKEMRNRVSLEELKLECPSLAHDQITDADVRLAILTLEENSYIELDLAGVIHSRIEERADALEGYESLTPEELISRTEWLQEDDDLFETRRFDYVKSVSLSDMGMDSLDRRRRIPNDKFAKFRKMSHDEIYYFFEELISSFDYSDPIRYKDRRAIVTLEKDIKDELSSNLDRLMTLIVNNNAVMSSRTSDLESALTQLREGTEVVKQGKFSVGRIEGALFGCLTFFATKFADAPIGDLAQTCWALLKSAIHNFIS